MERRWRGATMVLGLLLVGALGWGIWEANARRQTQTQLLARYQQQFFDALGHVENIEVLLSKAVVSAAPAETVRYLSELWQHAFAAQANLNALPIQPGGAMRTSRFLTQLGDYSFVLGQSLARGEALGDDDVQTLQQLQQQVALLGLELEQAVERFTAGKTPWADTPPRMRPANVAADLSQLPQAEPPQAEDDFLRIERQLSEFPTLVYDGPFSDHVQNREPRGLGEGTVSADEANNIARNFVSPENSVNLEAENTGETGEAAVIGAWGVAVRQQTGSPNNTWYLDVSKRGGHVLWMLSPRDINTPTLSLPDAVERARAFLRDRGFESFEVTYPVVEGGRAIIPFVLVEDDVLIYPDQMKVSVALDNGEIVGYEAIQYYTAHHTRTLPEPEVSEDEAAKALHADLHVEEVRLALIPRENGDEVLTYEFRARSHGNLYHVYVNALTGRQEQILRILETDQQGLLAQ